MRAVLLCSAASLLAAAFTNVRAQWPDTCAPSSEVRAAIDGLPVRSIFETSWEYQQKRLRALRSQLSRYPEDMFVQRASIQQALQSERDQVTADYRARYRQKPDDPQVAYLYALTLEGRNSPEAIKILEGALSKTPDYPWPHQALTRIYSSPAFQNKTRAAAHIQAFLQACPATIGPYHLLTNLDDKALLASSAARLRALVEKRTDAEAVGAYQTLWSLEFKTHNTSEYPAVRKQVSQDLERIRSLRLEDKQPWYSALQNGYKLVNDQKQADWAADEQERRFPLPAQLNAVPRWMKDHSWPKPDDPTGKKREFYSDLLKQTGVWLQQRPNAVYFRGWRLDAMAHLDDVSDAELETAAEEYLQFAEKDAGPQGPYPYTYFSVAEGLERRHLKPQRRVEIAQKGLARWETVEPMSDLYATKDNLAEYNFYRVVTGLRGLALATGGYLDLKQSDKARGELARMDERLRSLKEAASAKEEYKTEHSGQMALWWGLMARAAEMEKRPLDAMAFYTNALLARLDSQQKPETGTPDELAENARQLWTRLGGTREGWNTWYGRRADALARQTGVIWEPKNEPLPAFELTDTTGKLWNLASLKGKINFLNFWASW